jgi:copper transport protein
VSAVTTTTYGRLLLAKTAGFAVLVGLGGLNRRSIRRQYQRRLGPVVRAELGVAAVVLSLTAMLINAQPAKQAYIPSYRTTVAAGSTVRVRAIIRPTRAGPATLDVYTSTKDGTRLSVPEVTAKLSLQGTGLPSSISELRATMQAAGPGHVVSSGLDVPIPGQWKLDIAVRVDEINEYYADPIVVRFR